jgi:cytochrome c oxidase assembly protein subunit 15
MPEMLQQNRFLNLLLLAGIAASLLQIVLGTQVREAIDEIAAMLAYTQRDTWIDQIGLPFYIHRSFSLLIFALHLWFVRKLYQNTAASSPFRQWALALLVLLLVEIGSGVVMAYFAIPAIMQPLHLLAGSLICGVQFILLMLINYRQVFKPAQSITQERLDSSLKTSFQ